jgi:hypothetical protein
MSLRAIWLKRFKRGPMDPQETATLRAGKGLVDNANQGGRRQVILLEEEAWSDALTELGVSLDPATRRANLLLAGVRLEGTRGRILRVGPCRLRIFPNAPPASAWTKPARASRSPCAPTGGAAPAPKCSKAGKAGWEMRWLGGRRGSRSDEKLYLRVLDLFDDLA